MEAKEAKDKTKEAKDKIIKKKDDYDKLTEPEKQVIRDDLIAKTIVIIDRNIIDVANMAGEYIVVRKDDKLLIDMDAEAITQLFTIYETPGQGGERFYCYDNGSHIRIEWGDAA
jgi:hypothetical protein